MTHIAVKAELNGANVVWMGKVSDAQYNDDAQDDSTAVTP